MLIVIVVAVSSYFWADGKLNKSVALPATTATSAGTNWLIVGSDSRQGLSRTQRDALHVGSESAQATPTRSCCCTWAAPSRC